MYKTPNDRELMVGVIQYPVFGPVINFDKSSIPYHHMAIPPYPSALVTHWQLTDGTPIVIRQGESMGDCKFSKMPTYRALCALSIDCASFLDPAVKPQDVDI